MLCVILLAASSADAGIDNAETMKSAQAALAAGDYEKAFAAYHAAAGNNNALAQFSVGLFFQNGWGRAVDKAAACQWFEQAAQGGIPTGQYQAGICLEEGIHRPPDHAAAADWFEKAA